MTSAGATSGERRAVRGQRGTTTPGGRRPAACAGNRSGRPAAFAMTAAGGALGLAVALGIHASQPSTVCLPPSAQPAAACVSQQLVIALFLGLPALGALLGAGAWILPQCRLLTRRCGPSATVDPDVPASHQCTDDHSADTTHNRAADQQLGP